MLAALRARLTARLTAPRWQGVRIAEDIDILTEMAGQVESGTAIVMPFRERATAPVAYTVATRQLVEEHLAVGIVLRVYDEGLGGDRALSFAACKHDLEKALAGWVPPGSPGDCVLLGGESNSVGKGVSIYVQTWAIRRFLTGPP